jgi:hypothetical protein
MLIGFVRSIASFVSAQQLLRWYSYDWFALIYDIILGLLGIALTASAVRDFPHKNISNHASGTLDDHATVTDGEMVEHLFYQCLNLVQILYIHAVSAFRKPLLSIILCLFATAPWLLRHRFPVNSFSANYSPNEKGRLDDKSNTLVRILYRIKKYQ